MEALRVIGARIPVRSLLTLGGGAFASYRLEKYIKDSLQADIDRLKIQSLPGRVALWNSKLLERVNLKLSKEGLLKMEVLSSCAAIFAAGFFLGKPSWKTTLPIALFTGYCLEKKLTEDMSGLSDLLASKINSSTNTISSEIINAFIGFPFVNSRFIYGIFKQSHKSFSSLSKQTSHRLIAYLEEFLDRNPNSCTSLSSLQNTLVNINKLEIDYTNPNPFWANFYSKIFSLEGLSDEMNSAICEHFLRLPPQDQKACAKAIGGKCGELFNIFKDKLGGSNEEFRVDWALNIGLTEKDLESSNCSLDSDTFFYHILQDSSISDERIGYILDLLETLDFLYEIKDLLAKIKDSGKRKEKCFMLAQRYIQFTGQKSHIDQFMPHRQDYEKEEIQTWINYLLLDETSDSEFIAWAKANHFDYKLS